MEPQLLSWDRNKLLGKGAYAYVYAGKLNGQDVAVKRLQIEDAAPMDDCVVSDREVEAMIELDHPNVLKLLFVKQDENFKYIVLELCAGTIEDFCMDKYKGPMPSEAQCLYQMASGLEHIHSSGFVHRDIKAANVLIQPTAVNVLLKISDFGFCKPATANGSFSMSQAGKGTQHYIAPELLKLMEQEEEEGPIRSPSGSRRRGKVTSDVFSLGCLFFSLLTKGIHPFFKGRVHAISTNIIEGKYFLDRLRPELEYTKPIIESMIQSDPERRPTLLQVKEQLHQYL